eukprot:15467665-Alexandrium_andersonii.AAC.1
MALGMAVTQSPRSAPSIPLKSRREEVQKKRRPPPLGQPVMHADKCTYNAFTPLPAASSGPAQ